MPDRNSSMHGASTHGAGSGAGSDAVGPADATASLTSAAPLRLEVIDSAGGLASLRKAWELLETLDPTCTPVNTWAWAMLWWKHFGEGHELKIVVCRRHAANGNSSRVVAIAPMQLRHERAFGVFPIKVLRFIGATGDTAPDHLNVIAQPTSRTTVERLILGHLFAAPDWQRLHLAGIASPSSLEGALEPRLELEPGWRLRGRRNTIHVDDLPVSWENYRFTLVRRHRNRQDEDHDAVAHPGIVELKVASTGEEIADARDALCRLHRAHGSSERMSSTLASPASVAFHRDMIASFAARDDLWLATLKLDDEIIGVQCVFHWKDTLQFFQSGYAPGHDDLNPGHRLFTYVLGEGIAQGLTRVEMLEDDYLNGVAYARQTLQTREFRFVRPGFLNWLVRLRALT